MNTINIFMKKKYLFFIYISFAFINVISAQNLLTNGNFEVGGSGFGFNINSGFYNAVSPPFSGITTAGNYAIANNPQSVNNSFISGGDHSTAGENMLIVDGTSTGGNQRFWRAGNNGEGICNLTVGATYFFSYWIKSVSIQNRANIDYQFNNATNVTLITGFSLAPLPSSGWQQVAYTFTPTNSCVNFELWDTTTSDFGNDFAVDDFELVGPPLPLTLTYSVVNPSCPGANDGYIIAYASGANFPYVYFIDAPVQIIASSGIFTGLSAGTYSIRVLEAADGETTINNIVLADPPDLVVNSPTNICLGGNTNLNVSGSTTGYNWTASPTDNSLVDPSSPNPNVSPTQTTTYTVTSANSSSTNLVFNGDFSAGNIGFQTDYVYYSPNNPTGIQRAYGIVTNANTWQSGFSNCTDHTSGNGNMMVVDGSIVNGSNNKVWCQTIPVTPNQNYTFSYWVQTLAAPTRANLDVIVNGLVIGNALAPPVIPSCGWEQRTYVWNSGANKIAQICIYDRETALLGNDFAIDDLSFIGSVVECNRSKSVTITVDNPITPSFEPIIPICSGQILGPLQTTSAENITGSWTPVLNNTATTTYTFTPALNQCATTTTLEIVVNNNATAPIFFFGTSETFCFGTPIDAPLPTFSENAIIGSWSPLGINTQLLGTSSYIFTPDANQCAAIYTLTVTILPNINTEFAQINPICIGDPLAPLPTISNNNITGSWSPAIDETLTTTYIFTADPNQCASNATMEIIVNNNATPIFDFGDNLIACFQPVSEGPPAPLPTTSNNGIEGIWNSFAINYSLLGTSTYIFIPNNNLCASSYTLTVNIIEAPAFTVNAGCDGENFVLSVTLFEIVENSNFIWYNELNEVIGTNASVIITTKGTYRVVKEINGCTSQQIVNVPNVYCKIPRGISPNDDTLNDFFDLSNLKVKELQIFNRYGTEVYSKINYKKEWDGRTDNGNELPDGTYYYVINFETGKSKTGWVYINKEY